MKKYFVLLGLAAAVSTACSVKEELAPAPEKEVLTVVEAVAAPAAKTALGEKDGKTYPVYWSSGDMIIINNVGSSPLQNVEEHQSRASFEFNEVLDGTYYAGYPAGIFTNTDLENHTADVILPAVQNYVPGSFDPDAAVMVGIGDSENGLQFSSPMAYLKLTIAAGSHTDHKISSIQLTSVDGEGLSGTFSTNYDTLAVTAASVGELTLRAAEGIELGGTAVIAVPAQTYAHGIIIKVTDTAGHIMRKRSADNYVLKAGKVYPTSVVFEPTGTETEVGIRTEADLIAFLNEADGLVDCPHWFAVQEWTDTIPHGDISRWIAEDGEVHILEDITLTKRINWSTLIPGERYCSVSNFAPQWVLNGEGHTITADFYTPMFINVYGTIKNIKFAGTMAEQRTCELASPVACTVQEGGLISNVDNLVNITGFYPEGTTGMERARYMAGIAYKVAPGGSIMECNNYGTISDDGRGLQVISGIAAMNYGSITNCHNYGTLDLTATNPAAGICFNMLDGVITGCSNEVNLTSSSPQSRFAGICYQLEGGTLEGCENNGDITQTIDVTKAGGLTYSGGIVAVIGPRTFTTNGSHSVVQQDTLDRMVNISSCTNKGNISFTLNGTVNRATTAPAFGGIVSWINVRTTDEAFVYINECINNGTITLRSNVLTGSYCPAVGGIVGHSGPYGTTGSNTTPPLVLGLADDKCKGDPTDGTYVMIENCSNSGSMDAKNVWGNDIGDWRAHWQNGIGGIVGTITGKSTHPADIIGCTNTGAVAGGGFQTSGNRESAISVNGANNYPVRASRTVNLGGIAGVASFVNIQDCSVNANIGSRDQFFAHSVGGAIGAAFGRFTVSCGTYKVNIFNSNWYKEKWFGLIVGYGSSNDSHIPRIDNMENLSGSSITGVSVQGNLVNDPWQKGVKDYTYYDACAGNFESRLLSEPDNTKNQSDNWCTVSDNSWTGTSRTTSNIKTLSFDFNLSDNPHGWPTGNNVTEQSWSMKAAEDGESYEFTRKGGYLASASGTYYFVLQGRYIGFPVIEGYALHRAIIVLGNGSSTRNFGISSVNDMNGTAGAPSYVPGGSLLSIQKAQTGPFVRSIFDPEPGKRYYGYGNTTVIKELILTYIEEE